MGGGIGSRAVRFGCVLRRFRHSGGLVLAVGLGRAVAFGRRSLGLLLTFVVDAAFLVGHFGIGRTTTVCGVQVDDIAQQDAALDQGFAPEQQRLDGQRTFADAADHLLAAGLDALGDGDLALAREQLDRAHLAQVHAHGIVGAADVLVGDVAGGGALLRRFGRVFLGLVALDHGDAHFREHGHGVLDLLRGHLVGWEHLVQLVVGDVAALLGLSDHLFDGRAHGVHQRCVGGFFAGIRVLSSVLARLGRHAVSMPHK